MIHAVELENISKTFPGDVEANKNITLRIEEGEVHGLLGENGAGKSTLMNVLYGLLSKDEGSGPITIKGEQVNLRSPEDAIARGVGMVHQHFKLIPPLTVTENVMMGMEPESGKANIQARLVLLLISIFIGILLLYTFGLLIGAIMIGLYLLVVFVSFRLNSILTYIIVRLSPLLEQSGVKARIAMSIVSLCSMVKYGVGNLMPMGFKVAEEKIKQISEENGLDIDPREKIMNLSVGLQQRVEIIKALYRDAEILILDEPTSVLTPQEVDELFVTLERFRDAGKTIILITHKLREPMILCDRISVLRDGELVGTVNKEETSPEDLAQMMVGRPVVFRVEKAPPKFGDVVFSVKDLVVEDARGVIAVDGVSLEVHAGEIYGIAGVEGNGQTELVEGLTGLIKPKSGKVMMMGKDITGKSPRTIRAAGIAHIPEDRHKRGLVLPFTIEENLVLGEHYREPYASSRGILNLNKIHSKAAKLVNDYSVKVGKTMDPASTLSGGNQQKLVVARELSSNPLLLIAAQPTRGLDVGATEYIHNVLIALRDSGVAVLLISAELDEIRSLSDTIGVIFDGRIVATKDPEMTTAQELGLLMAGHSNAEEVVS
ncbi:MAG: ABC transporter ATP-binding protein [Candidatus Thorarchaeota archaeon]